MYRALRLHATVLLVLILPEVGAITTQRPSPLDPDRPVTQLDIYESFLELVRAPTQADTLPESAGNPAYLQGLRSLAAGELQNAEKAFREALELDPASAHAMLALAEVAFKRDDMRLAAQWTHRAAEAAPERADVQASLGRLLALEGQYDDAEAAWRKAIELDPRAVQPRMDLADSLTTQRRFEQSLALYREVIAIDPDHAGAHYASGIAVSELGDSETAESMLKRAAGLAPKNPLPYIPLARIQAAGGDFDKGLASVDKALAIDSGLMTAIVLKGDLLDAAGRSDEALAVFSAAAEGAPADARPVLKAAMLYHGLGRADEAITAYREALARHPQNAVAHNNLAALLLDENEDLADAETHAARAVELAPDNPDYNDTLAWVRRAAGRGEEALKAIRKAAAIAPGNHEIKYHLAVLLSENGKKLEAANVLQGALSDPGIAFPSAADARALLDSLRE